jgi:hypothetical protein
VDPLISAGHDLRTGLVVRVAEEAVEVSGRADSRTVAFAPRFPRPRVERVAPGHLVAVATAPDGREAVVWRWFDAVVLGGEVDGSVRLWEPGHGEVVARPRPSYGPQRPGSRAWLSAGLPGADWWVATATGDEGPVELDEVRALYGGDWSAVFEPAG